MIIGILGVFVFLLVINIPISFVLCIVGTVFIIVTGVIPLDTIPHKMWNGLDQFVYTAIPMFMLSGEIMNEIGVTQRLVKVASKCVGWISGGLAHVSILSAMVISGISGSAVADSVAIGTVLIPSMKKVKYRGADASAIVAAACVNGPIIPPSNAMVVYSAILGLSVGSLFIAGFVPVILLGLGLMVVCYILAVKGRIPKTTTSSSDSKPGESDRLHWVYDVILPASLPVIIIGGVIFGVATATEVAAVAVLAATLYGFFVYRALTVKKFLACVSRCIIPTSIIFFLIAGSGALGIVFTLLRVPEQVSSSVLELTKNKYIVLLVMNVFLLFMGAIMDASANLLILAPILAPVAIGLGVDPLHFALVFIVNICIGMITPPVGSLLFSVCPIGKVSIGEITARIWPLLVVEIVVLLIITYVPITVVWLPRLFHVY
jgi:tripartite ATP-independent transporter DctM subunit